MLTEAIVTESDSIQLHPFKVEVCLLILVCLKNHEFDDTGIHDLMSSHDELLSNNDYQKI